MITQYEYMQAKIIVESYEMQLMCKHEEVIHKEEHNVSPYGHDYEYDICKRCKAQINFKVK